MFPVALLALVILSPERVELQHLPAVADVTFARNEISPFAMEVDEREIYQSVHHQNPHHREMPIAGAGQPASECQPARNRLAFPRIAAE